MNFWGSNHVREITGPRGFNLPSVRLLDPPRPGRVEAADLILDLGYHPGRARLDVGADLLGLYDPQNLFERVPVLTRCIESGTGVHLPPCLLRR